MMKIKVNSFTPEGDHLETETRMSRNVRYLTIIPRVRMGYESIAHEDLELLTHRL